VAKRTRPPTRSQALKATLIQDWGAYGVEPKHWSKIQALCLAIAGHYPHSKAGQESLSTDLGWSRRTVQRYVGMAVAAGILDVTPNSGMGGWHGHWRTNTYRLWYLHRAPRMAHGPDAMGVAQSDTPKGVSPKGEKEISSPSPRRKELAIPKTESLPENSEAVAMVGKWKDDQDNPDNWMREQAIGEPDEPQPGAVVSISPANRLARQFERQWISKVLKRQPIYRGTRIIDSGPAIGYLKAKMLTHLSADHVQAYVDEFMAVVADGTHEVRDGQSAWQSFTGWWGRVPVEDPATKQAKRDEFYGYLDQYRKMHPEA
jgi:hypothetical protein